MDRTLLETVDLLGLDVMLGMIASLAILARLEDVVRQRRQARELPRTAGNRPTGEPSRPEFVPTDWVGPSRSATEPHAQPVRLPLRPKTRPCPADSQESEVA